MPKKVQVENYRWVDGKDYPVWLDSDGNFRVNLGKLRPEDRDDTVVDAPAYVDVLDKLNALGRKLTRVAKASVQVEFWRWEPGHGKGDRKVEGKLARGWITGIHATNENLLIKWEGVQGGVQESSYSYRGTGNYMNLPTEELRAEYAAAKVAAERANAEVTRWEDAHGLVGKDAVTAAIIQRAEAKVGVDDAPPTA